jgi:FkbM family methyltransferase
MMAFAPEVRGRSRMERVLLRAILSASTRGRATFHFRYKGRLLEIANDPTAINHALLSTAKLARLVASVPDAPSLVVDVGANCGHFGALVRDRFPAARILAVEPNPSLRDIILRNCPPAIVHTVGAGAREDTLEFQLTAGSQQSTFVQDQENYLHDATVVRRVRVPVRPLDDIVAEVEPTGPVVVKVDVQGFEPEVVAGAQRTLRNCSALYIEATWLFPRSVALISRVMRDFGFVRGLVLSEVTAGADILLLRTNGPGIPALAEFSAAEIVDELPRLSRLASASK